MFATKRKSLLLSMSLLLALSAAVAGCSTPKTENAGATAETAATGNKEETVTMAWPRDIGPMNPHLYNPSQLFAQSMIYEPLVAYKDGKIVPHLAESWTLSPDGKEYTFKLRSNVKFSDGTAFTAATVKKNFDAVLKNMKLHTWLGVISVLEKTEAVDDATFKMTLKEAYYPTLHDLAVVRPVRFLAESGFPDDGDTSKGVKNPIGTGPWMLGEYKKDESATFIPNPNYWGEKPKVDKVVVKVVPDAETRVLAFEKGDLDLIFGEGVISFDAYKQLEQTGKYEAKLSEPVGTRNLVLNTMNEKLADLRVRQALHQGFNKQAMVEGVTLGMEEKADNILPKNLPYANIDVKPVEYNVEQAKALLEEAGWKLSAGKTVREKDGKALELELLYDKADLTQKAMAETLQAEWAAIGVKLNITGVELTVYIQRRKANEFDMNFYSNFGAPYDPHSFMTGVVQKGFGLSDPLQALPMKAEIDQKIKEGMTTTDEKARTALFSSVLTTLQEQSSILPISYIKKLAVYQKDVSTVQFPSNRDEHPFYGIDTKE
ncbi:nickel transport system nickel-binding protein [Paenibacillus mucilaginosus 3016]|uniref:Nickel transport system nickel-binding protein n=1 Tax=Paenibacillus mucilaginosus 3016 TaxID=1116391 RepID=H6NPH0_9BACL|nr:nickel ABC transporter substrate-binding protein [Paenibacillus mucilaginosus]AFC32582.1 nickel transport system nickel-binding protein [Paenibacillus mucilaginosus 3016]WFA21060.1 nickel ABC transporter, nickel/metallophore periplasmic binding protein [Paenibacillus mucilaginosus]